MYISLWAHLKHMNVHNTSDKDAPRKLLTIQVPNVHNVGIGLTSNHFSVNIHRYLFWKVFLAKIFHNVSIIRDNYSKQRPDIENLFTHPWSVSIGKTAFFVFKLLSFYVEWSDQHKFYMKLKEKLSTFKPTSKTSISKTKMLWNLIFLCSTSSIFTT